MAISRILVVEDETIVARDINQQLTELGYEPVGVCNRGEDVVDRAGVLQPDLILMDIQLAGPMDGVTAAMAVNEQLGIPVVFLTAFAESETFNRAKQSNPFGYIIKPFTERELQTVIEIALYKHRTELEQRRSENLLRTILQTAEDGYWLTDTAGRFLDVNPAAERITGYPRDELLTLSIPELDAERPPLDLRARLNELLPQTGTHVERQLIRKDGVIIDVAVNVQYLAIDGGRLVSFLRDITLEKARARELEIKSAALGAAGDAVVITGRSGNIEWVNAAFCSLTGYSLKEALGRDPGELVKSGRQDEAFYAEMWQEILAGRTWRGELVNRRKSGELFHEAMTITPVKNGGGEITHFIAIKRDISEKKEVEHALRQSEERYRLLFDHNPLPMWLYDDETLGFVAVNETAVQSYGYTRGEFLAMSITQIRPEEDRDRLREHLHEAQAKPLVSAEWRHRRKDGTVFPVAIISRPIEFQGRRVHLVMAEDISKKKELEEQFLRAQRLESLGQLASGIAHDLNNMLAPVLFAAPLLRDSLTSERDQKILDAVEHSGQRGTSLVRQILAFAQGTTSAPRIVQLKHIARDVVGILEVTLPRNITLESHIPSDVWPVEANPTQIHQVLLNLGVNARDAMPRGGTLSIVVSNRTLDAAAAAAIPEGRSGDWLVLEVSDTGTGIAPETLPHIWDSFFTTKPEGKGTGLGLATVRSIVGSHRGFIQLETAVGRGTTFRVFLPASKEEFHEAATPVPFPEVQGREEHILVVDDDAAVREILKTVLTQHHYRVVDCADGVEAIVRYNAMSRDIALVITDVDMPNLNGAVLAGTLRKLNPDLRIVAMSGLDSSAVGSEAMQEMRQLATARLDKPFTTDVLLRTVRRVLETDTPES